MIDFAFAATALGLFRASARGSEGSAGATAAGGGCAPAGGAAAVGAL